jgi:[glutamine synthetase] adenylyltransferase / [glutamine synthetase]-adenylyl-L-tyrosine phosphorylase
MTIQSLFGRVTLTDPRVPELESYSEAMIAEASDAWPAIKRYLFIVRSNLKPAIESLQRIEDTEKFYREIRIFRQSEWLNHALAVYFKKLSTELICRSWTRSAEKMISLTWSASGFSAGSISSSFSGAASDSVVLIAMGKLGAAELNMSSDIDLILVRRDGSETPDSNFRTFNRLLSENSEYGFCFRTDYNLRPGGTSSPMIPTLSEFQNYYSYHGELWERLAFVRHRILGQLGNSDEDIAGTGAARSAIDKSPATLAGQLNRFLERYSYRTFLDFSVVLEMKNLREKNRQERKRSDLSHINIKFDDGGIREIELYVHSLQVIHGGRNKTLRTRSTTEAISNLIAAGLLSENNGIHLLNTYWQLRENENQIQCDDDQHTYTSQRDQKLESLMLEANAITSEFFEDSQPLSLFIVSDEATSHDRPIHFSKQYLSPAVATAVHSERPVPDSALQISNRSEFNEISKNEVWPRILAATALSKKTERDENERRKFLSQMLQHLQNSPGDKNLGLAQLEDFVKGTRAKATFFALLNREKALSAQLAKLFCISPYLGGVVSRRPELIDSILTGQLAEVPDDFETLLESLAEQRLVSEIIGAGQFLNTLDLVSLVNNQTANADQIALKLISKLASEMKLPGDCISIYALGKWGGRELGIRSDLDFIFIAQEGMTQEAHRIAKRFLQHLSEPRKSGKIYHYDLRLRPSGNSGPLIVTRTQLKQYLKNDSAPWERQAYLRGRSVALPSSPANAKDDLRLNLAPDLWTSLTQKDISDLSDIRLKLFHHKSTDEIDLKLTRFGLADIEFQVQIQVLKTASECHELPVAGSTSSMIKYLSERLPTWKTEGYLLLNCYSELRTVEQMFQLCSLSEGSKLRLASDEFRVLAGVYNLSADELAIHLDKILARSEESLLRIQSASEAN